MTIKKIILRNVFSNWAYFFAQLFTGFFLMPFIVHKLGNSLYGIWVLVLSLTGYMGIFDIGVSNSIVKFVSKFNAEGDFKNLNKVATTSFIVQGLVGIVIIIFSIIGPSLTIHAFKIDPLLRKDFLLSFSIVGFALAIKFFFGLFSSILEAYKRADIMSNIEIATLILQSTLIVISLLNHCGIIVLSLILLCVNIIREILRAIFAFKICPNLSIQLKLANFQTLKLIFGYSFYIFVLTISSKLIYQTDNVIIGIFIGSGAITHYSIASRLVLYAQSFLLTVSGVLLPFASEFEAKKEHENIKKLLYSGTKYCFMISSLICLTFILTGKELITYWMGQDYILSYPILIILTLPYAVAPSYLIMNSLLKGIGKLRFLSAAIVTEAVINLILSIILVKRFGLIGVAWGTAIPMIINRGFIIPIYFLKLQDVQIWEFFKKSLLPVLRPVIILLISVALLFGTMKPQNIFSFISNLVILVLIYSLACFFFSLSSNEKKFFYQKLI
ncbi:MAG: hypothetical protein C4540_00070 [Candidatus Omnitrophota bacterium]|jgi:O-antigen/teichoic acid export membrane protein|nr:MAG: hypothetical protein C4540_00070 [Candidatus Omnitrophota bacterium]